MGKSGRAAIVSIGMFKFDIHEPQGPESISAAQTFHCAVSLKSCQKYGLEIDGSTVEWWLQQDDVARGSLQPGRGLDLRLALESASVFMKNDGPPEYNIFGNGAVFDNAILMNAFQAVGLDYPVSYKRNVCFRTIKNLFFGVGKQYDHYGVKHNALDDAISQGLALQKMMSNIRMGVL